MKKSDWIGGVIWLILGISICLGSVTMKMGNLHRPGPGFMPFLAGALLFLFGLILSVSAGFKRAEEEKGITSGKPGKGKNWRIFLFSLSALCGYALLLKPLGFYTATTVFLLFLFKVTHPQKWLIPLISTVAAVGLSYLLFSVWLKTPFPGGIIGF